MTLRSEIAERADHLKRQGIRRCKVFGIVDERVCPACAAFNGRKFDVHVVLDHFPPRDCSCSQLGLLTIVSVLPEA